ncbi:hypothetical protein J3F84DRAFT_359033 [Trichoderma pleuroticola]
MYALVHFAVSLFLSSACPHCHIAHYNLTVLRSARTHTYMYIQRQTKYVERDAGLPPPLKCLGPKGQGGRREAQVKSQCRERESGVVCLSIGCSLRPVVAEENADLQQTIRLRGSAIRRNRRSPRRSCLLGAGQVGSCSKAELGFWAASGRCCSGCRLLLTGLRVVRNR